MRIWDNMRGFINKGRDGTVKMRKPPKGYKDPEIVSRYGRGDDEIFEDGYEQKPERVEILNNIMDEKQKKRAEFYLHHYNTLYAEMEERKTEWEELQKLYRADLEIEEEDDPNCFVPIINPTVEGQIQTLDIDPQVTCIGEGYSDHQFARTGEILSTWTFRKNKIRKLIKRHERRRRGYIGTAWFKVVWDPDALDGFGMSRISCPSTTKVFVDGKIKDYMALQEADFIIEEIGLVSIMKLRTDTERKPINPDYTMSDIADAIALGNSELDFDGEISADDKDSFTLLHVWTRLNEHGNLQLIEMSKCGVIITESDPSEQYYTKVSNKYPYFVTVLYENEENFYGFSDGKLLKRMQILLNNLWNECVLACKHSAQNKTFVDPKAKVDPDDYAAGARDPRNLIPANDPQKNIKESEGKGINSVVFNLISLVVTEAQRIVRFSSLMTGTTTGRDMTARQAGMEMQEGSRGQDDKKADLSDTLADVASYCLGLMMENWDAAHAFRVSENNDFEWIDARELNNIPVLVPSDTPYKEQWRASRQSRIAMGLEQMGEVKDPQFMQLQEEIDTEEDEIDKETKAPTGKKKKKLIPKTKQLELDINVSIGEGLPTNKVALYNIILSLAKLQVPDEASGMPRSILTYEKVKKMLSDLLGIDLDEDKSMVNPQEQQYMQMIKAAMMQQGMQGGNQPRPVMNSANVPGETIGGNSIAV
jgi:hypothetical protein